MVLTVCLNPALQRTLWFSECNTNKVNRAIRKAYTVGGKGVNVARVIHQLGGNSHLLCLIGGGIGQDIEKLLQIDGISSTLLPVQPPTRICTTLIDLKKNTQTEIVEESEATSSDEVDLFYEAYQEAVQNASMVILSGTVPAGFEDTTYSACLEIANKHNVPAIIDASKNLLMSTLTHKPFFIKPNYDELMESVGIKEFSIDNIKKVLPDLNRQGAQHILITHENQPAWFYSDQKLYRLTFPQQKCINPIGAGDSIAAGFVVGCQQKMSICEAIRFGIACGCANVLTETAGNVHIQDVQSILPQIHMDVIN